MVTELINVGSGVKSTKIYPLNMLMPLQESKREEDRREDFKIKFMIK